jgi:hypothetical protein
LLLDACRGEQSNQREYGKPAPENNEIDDSPLRLPGAPRQMKISTEKS